MFWRNVLPPYLGHVSNIFLWNMIPVHQITDTSQKTAVFIVTAVWTANVWMWVYFLAVFHVGIILVDCSEHFNLMSVLYSIFQINYTFWVICVITSLWTGQPKNCGVIPGRGKDFALLQNVRTDSGVHAASSVVGTEGWFPRVKRLSMKMITDLQLELRLRMGGAVPPLFHISEQYVWDYFLF